MADEKLLTIRDVSHALGISEKEVIDLSENGAIPAYKIGGVYLRFKRQQVDEYRKKHPAQHKEKPGGKKKYSYSDRVSDFFYFNDFYILALIVIILMLFIIFRGY
ncbi:MAG: helix-turn-helix domain-containing protein [Candidatus Omnitrophica bacterium]|jgi:excisionase family DNA binding protein|nr:helix-turn-helix domain-containing protein [Candidatus Omnitrophota bacterium]